MATSTVKHQIAPLKAGTRIRVSLDPWEVGIIEQLVEAASENDRGKFSQLCAEMGGPHYGRSLLALLAKLGQAT